MHFTRIKRYAFLLIVVALGGCMSELRSVDMPLDVDVVPGPSLLKSEERDSIEGVYGVLDGSEIFGDTLVLRWVQGRLCIYSGTRSLFAETASATSAMKFDGYYREMRSTNVGGLTFAFEGLSASGGPLTAKGHYQPDFKGGEKPVTLVRARPFSPRQNNFYIIGHRAGGRNSERLGRSENSLEMAKFAERLGCTGIEIDIKLTKDNQLIVFHDESYSPRTVRSTYILGDVKSFTLSQVRHQAKLVYGEEIPTLEQFLDTVIRATTLELVWLDVKDPAASAAIMAIQVQAMRTAALAGRRLNIYFGIPDDLVLNAFRAAPLHDSVLVICELDRSILSTLPPNAIWAPRWTNGLQNSVVPTVQQTNEVVTWTLDSPDYMIQYLRDGSFNGILTNYPSMLAGLYYQR